MRLARLATCAVNAWALDFDGNLARTRASIAEARARGARYRLGPELELTGYGCEDHFLEPDTERHAWTSVAQLLREGDSDGLICDVGMPVTHRGVRYAARVLLLHGQVLLIRPRRLLRDGGTYREHRWFAPWPKGRAVESFELPRVIQETSGQERSWIGDALVETRDARIAILPGDEANHPGAVLTDDDRVDIVANPAASPHHRGETYARLRRVRAAAAASMAVHLHANQVGCDGGRTVHAGGAAIAAGGPIVAHTEPYSFADAEVATADVDLDRLRARRAARSEAERRPGDDRPYPVVHADVALTRPADGAEASPGFEPPTLAPAEEIGLGPALWSWDHLRRSGAGGFLLPLSGGSDSAAVAMVILTMCRHVATRIARGDETVAREVARIVGTSGGEAEAADARALARHLLSTVYLATRVSSPASRSRARTLADAIGVEHLEIELQTAVDVIGTAAGSPDGGAPSPLRFATEGGSAAEDLALQNLQARTRLVATYLLAQRLPEMRGVRGPRLVLGTSNIDETLVGYVTKYDTSSADLNPIGGIGKSEVRAFLRRAREAFDIPVLDEILAATPSAELRPASDREPQSDEADVGLTYPEIETLARLRALERCGPVAAFERLLDAWAPMPPRTVADKVRNFFQRYAANRHKTAVATPACHADPVAPDDHRADPRPILIDADWERPFRLIEERVRHLEARVP